MIQFSNNQEALLNMLELMRVIAVSYNISIIVLGQHQDQQDGLYRMSLRADMSQCTPENWIMFNIKMGLI